MDLDIRKAVIKNLNGATFDDVRLTIQDAIANGEEKVLPGLGVLLELVWQNTSNEWQQDFTHQLTNLLQ